MSEKSSNDTSRRGCRCEDHGESGGCACGKGCRCAPCDCDGKA